MVQKIPVSGLENAGGNFKNLLVNGDYQIWQRGTSAATVTDSSSAGTYLADRWQTWEDTGGTITQEQSALDNDDFETTGMRNALLVKCTGTDSSIGAAEFAMITQTIEAQNCQGLQYGTDNAKDLTLSFWVKSNLTGTFNAIIRKPDSTYYYIPKEYTISSANTWEKKTITYGPDDTNGSVIKASTGNIVNDNGEGIWVQFNLAMGSNFHCTAGTWANAITGLGTSNQTNFMSSTSNNFYLTGVQLEAGSGASDFEHLPFDVQLQRCMRYCNVMNGTHEVVANYSTLAPGYVTAATQGYFTVVHPVPMRLAPSETTSADSDFLLADGVGGSIATTGIAVNHAGSNRTLLLATVSSGLSAGRGSAMLYNNKTTATLTLDAEL